MSSNLQYHYYEEFITDIPWESNPMFHSRDNMAAYAAAVRLIIGDKPVNKSIPWAAPVWDFNKTHEEITTDPANIMIWTSCSEEVQHYGRWFVVHKIEKRKKISTINARLAAVSSVINAIAEKTPHKSIGVIDTDDIIAEIRSRDISATFVHSLYEGLYQFYYFLEENCRRTLPVNLQTLKALGVEAKRMSKNTEKEDKWPDIPRELFKRIFGVCLKVMRDIYALDRDRMIAATIILLTQLGVRLGDLLNLRVNSMYEEDADGLTMHYLNYSVEKLSKPHAPQARFDIFLSELGVEAFNILKKLRVNCAHSAELDYLIMYPNTCINKRTAVYPMKRSNFRAAYCNFLYKFLREDVTRPWTGIRKKVCYVYEPLIKKNIKVDLYVPTTPQYRVRLCTYLVEHGVKLSYVEEHLAHLSEMMYGYYARPKDNRQEIAEQAETFIKNILVDDMVPIGAHSEELKVNLLDFLKRKKVNVAAGLSEVMKQIDPEVAIRAKTGGFCYKSSFLSCPNDPHTKKLLCAFNHCPNVYSFFYMADISYAKLKACEDAYYANLQRGLKNAAHKEVVNAQDIINRTLNPQIFQLERELEKHEAEDIIDRYPALKPIVEHLEEIKQEIRIWKTKI